MTDELTQETKLEQEIQLELINLIAAVYKCIDEYEQEDVTFEDARESLEIISTQLERLEHKMFFRKEKSRVNQYNDQPKLGT